ncbi:serine/threonine protein kinase/tetratricopeptide (TPR) repeat protein [Rhodopirellula rubra]|uniref:Serine/threonine protein kinase/tetratricopeptide (TPR) repeat protein n=1 Tax=Aporhodopirellula rubra TaxID=980271 RepID=A0A7W5H832_9BACT|nr:protein kinase [Aporhodopirellula rubra]MBB3210277.1 serine/threonine protein kinase/tetratricopeptide (TPR) repeat protein [Aporhodopirellula rubra]
MSVATSRYRAGQEIVPGYTLVRRLGAGFSGQVWVARAAGGTEVALKVVELHKIGGRKELKALRTIRNVRHPNLCPVHSFWVRDSSGRLLRDDETETLDPDNEHLKTGPVPVPVSRQPPVVQSPEISLTETRAFDVLENLKESSEIDGDESSDDAPEGEFAGADDADSKRTSDQGESGEANDSLLYETMVSDSGAISGSVGSQVSDPMATMVPVDASPSQFAESAHAEELIIVMGLGDGTLNDRLHEVRREKGIAKNSAVVCGLDAKEAIRYLRSSAQAIDALLDQHGILHGDIKPQNILLVGGEAQVCDFGLANKIEGDIRFTNQTFASPAYGAPEVLDGQTYSKTGDQYSLAVTYFELRTGLLPFDATTALKILSQKASESFNLQNIPSAQRKVLRRAMRSDPNARYKSCVEFVDALAVAAGVEKAGGLNPVWVAIGGVVLAFAIAGGVAALLPTTGKSPEETFAEAATEWKKYSPRQNYSQARYPLKRCLDKVGEGLAGDVKSPQRQRFRSLAADTSGALADEILELLELPRFDEKGQLLLSGLVVEDLGVLQSTLESDGPISLVAKTSAEGEHLQADIDLARLQLSLLAEMPEHLPDTEAMIRIRESLDEKLKTGIQLELDERNDDAKTVVSMAVAVALTHHAETPADGYFVQSTPFADIIRAQHALQLDRPNDLPPWMMSLWNTMRDGESGFLAQIERAFRERTVDAETLDQIASTWPSISVEASMTRLKRLAEQRDWPGFVTLQKSLQSEVAKTKIDDANLTTQFGFLQMMADAVSSDEGLDFLEPAQTRLNAIETSWRSSMRQAIIHWVEEIATRAIAASDVLSVAEAEKVWRTGAAISETILAPVPEVLDRLVVVAAMVEASPSSEANDQVNASASRLSRATHPIGLLYQSERSASERRRLGRSSGRRLAQLLGQVGVCDDLPEELRRVICDYHMILADWHQGETDSVLARIENLQVDSPQSPNVLGPRRCQWIATTLLQSEVDRLDTRRNDFFVTGLPEAADVIEHVRWWLHPHDNLTPEMEDSLRILAAHAAVVQGDESATLSASLRERLADLIVRHHEKPSAKKLSAEDRLLVRIAFEVDKRPLVKDGSGSQDAAIETDIETAERMIGTASMMLDADLGFRNPTQAWVRNVIAPTMHRVLSVVRRSHSEATGWTIPRELDSESIYRFSRHASRADAFTSLGDELAKRSAAETGHEADGSLLQIDAMEVFSAVAGDDAARSAGERFRCWIHAAECFQNQLERRNQTWTGTNLRQFAIYIKRAERIEPSSSLVAILKAFAIYHQARMRLASGQISHLDLEKTASALGRAIDLAENEPPSNAYFCVCWRHANLLVNLAFAQPASQKYETLVLARKSAMRATQMIGKLPATTQTNPAYLALGNACEDLAYYCRFLDDDTRTEFFKEAIANFSEAVGKTEWGQSILPRFSLVRCRQRYVESGLAGAEQYRVAMSDLGDIDPDAPIALQVEWLGWRAQLHAKLGERDAAIRDAARAYEMLTESDLSEVSRHNREEAEYMYADILATSQTRAERERALDLLSEPLNSNVPITAWKSFVLRCRILDSIGEDAKLAETVLAASVETLIQQIKRDPIQVTQQLAEISFYLNRAGCPISLGRPTRLKPATATECLGRIETATDTALNEVESDEVVEAYAALISANAATIGEASLSQRVKRYLDALDSPGVPNIDGIVRADTWRCLVRQFLPVFRPSAGFSDEARTQLRTELPLISTEDRDRLSVALASLRSADTPPTDDEKYVMTSIEQVLPQVKPQD